MLINWKLFRLKIFEKGGGGGGGAGVIDYPDYMEIFHEDMLWGANISFTTSISETVNAATIAGPPMADGDAYDPAIPVATMNTATDTLTTLVNLLSAGTGLDALIINVLSDDRIDNAVDEYSADLDARFDTEVLPKFNAGMRDIGAVTSSAFAIGRAIIAEGQTREIGKFSAELHLKAFGDDALQLIAMKLEYQKVVSHMIVEANRIGIVAFKEETDTNIKLGEANALWDLELFQYGSNALASIGGGTVSPGMKGPSTAQSVAGGAMAGAAAGMMYGSMKGSAVSPGWGTVIGGVLGAAVGYLSA